MARRKRFAAAGRKKAKVRGAFVGHVRRDILLEQWDGRCGICGYEVNPKNFTVDHIIPISRGGTHCYENCQPAHAFCNSHKGNLLPDEMGDFCPVRSKRSKLSYRNHGLGRRKRIAAPSARAA